MMTHGSTETSRLMHLDQVDALFAEGGFIENPSLKALVYGVMGDHEVKYEGQLERLDRYYDDDSCLLIVLYYKVSLFVQKILHQLKMFFSCYNEKFNEAKHKIKDQYEHALQGRLMQAQQSAQLLLQKNGEIQQVIEQLVAYQHAKTVVEPVADIQQSEFLKFFEMLAAGFQDQKEQTAADAQESAERLGLALLCDLLQADENGSVSINMPELDTCVTFADQHGEQSVVEQLIVAKMLWKEAEAGSDKKGLLEALNVVAKAIWECKSFICGWRADLLTEQKRGVDEQLRLVSMQVDDLRSTGVVLADEEEAMDIEGKEQDPIFAEVAEQIEAGAFSQIEKTMLTDMSRASHPEIAQVWMILMEKCYASNGFEEGVVESWTFNDTTGEFEIQLTQPITMWVHNEAYADNGGVLMMFGAATHGTIRGTFVKGHLPSFHRDLVRATVGDDKIKHKFSETLDKNYKGILYEYDDKETRGCVQTYCKHGVVWPLAGARHLLRVSSAQEGKMNLVMGGTAKVCWVVKSQGGPGSIEAFRRSWTLEGAILPRTSKPLNENHWADYLNARARIYPEVKAGTMTSEEAHRLAWQSLGV